MKKRIFYLGVGSCLLIAGGCAYNREAPEALAFPASTQYKMHAAEHWGRLASKNAEKILGRLNDRKKTIYIERASPGMAKFSNIYSDMLTECLSDNGGLVVTDPAYAEMIVNHEVQMHFAKNEHRHNAVTGAWEEIPIRTSENDVMYGSTPLTEVIVTTRLQEGRLILMSETDAFYMNPRDSEYYSDQPVAGRHFMVVGQ